MAYVADVSVNLVPLKHTCASTLERSRTPALSVETASAIWMDYANTGAHIPVRNRTSVASAASA